MDHSEVLGLWELALVQSQYPVISKRSDYFFSPVHTQPGKTPELPLEKGGRMINRIILCSVLGSSLQELSLPFI